MKRDNFIKTLSLTTLGVSSGIVSPSECFAESKMEGKLKMPSEKLADMTVDKNHYLFGTWLLQAVAGALIAKLVGKVFDYYQGNNCYCNGSSCTNNNAPSNYYSNTVGYYGYDTMYNRFLTQQIYDRSISFNNASVPFVNRDNYIISSVEGPYLAGLCYAANDLASNYSAQVARAAVVPYDQISNGGYRFDIQPCYPTVLKTNYGTTSLTYSPKGRTGVIEVEIANRVDKIDYRKAFLVNAA